MARTTLLLLAFWALVVVTQLTLASQLDEQSTAVSGVSVEGIVFCDQCLQKKITKSSNLLKGAQVALVCDSLSAEKEAEAVVVAVTTDEKGRFVAVLPAAAFDGTGQISCAAELRQSPRKSCQLPATPRRTSPEFSRQEPVAGKLVYSVGTLSYRPESAGTFCAQATYYSPEYKPPVYKPPVYEPPVYKPPVEKPPVEKPPVYKPPVEKPPIYKPPVEEPPIYKPPVEEPPIYKYPVVKPPVYKPPPDTEPKFKFPKFRFPKFKFPKDKYPPKYPPTR